MNNHDEILTAKAIALSVEMAISLVKLKVAFNDMCKDTKNPIDRESIDNYFNTSYEGKVMIKSIFDTARANGFSWDQSLIDKVNV